MESFRVRPLSEADIDEVIAAAGGERAHDNTDRRAKPSADYRLGVALIELKALDDEGLEKSARQGRLAALFRQHQPTRPVIVLDRATLPEDDQRVYDRVLEGPVKGAVDSARKQLKQSRSEHPKATTSILLLANNGYTALDHEGLLKLAAHRVRNDTTEIDGIVVAGCYFYSDTFESYFLWPIEYVPINVDRPFNEYQHLLRAWNDYANRFMTAVVRGDIAAEKIKGPVVDTHFNVDGVTYVKLAPPIGNQSEFFVKGRPRGNSSEIAICPPVATIFPDMTRSEWERFHAAMASDAELFDNYDEWQAHRMVGSQVGTTLKPFIPLALTFQEWMDWCENERLAKRMPSIRAYANHKFDTSIRAIIARARERSSCLVVPA